LIFNRILSKRYDVYGQHRRSISSQPSSYNVKLNLLILCHSTAVEEQMLEKQARNAKRRPADEVLDTDDADSEYEEDEYGNKCSTYTQIEIYSNDRVITLKKLVEARFGIALDDQILVYKDKIIKNDLKQLCALNVRQFARIHIFDKRDLKADQDEMDLLSKANIYGIYQNCNKTNVVNAENPRAANVASSSTDAPKIIKTRPPPMPPVQSNSQQKEAASAAAAYTQQTNGIRRKYSTIDRSFDRESSYRRQVREESKPYMPSARDTVDFYNRSGASNAFPQRADSVRYQYQPVYSHYGKYNNFAEESLSYRKY
jgi:hypothetical protein